MWIGDETCIIAALMGMWCPKSIVLSGALSALFAMTVSTQIDACLY
jgi:Ca2+/H+ antiporter, TMEM165/GDT1 family